MHIEQRGEVSSCACPSGDRFISLFPKSPNRVLHISRDDVMILINKGRSISFVVLNMNRTLLIAVFAFVILFYDSIYALIPVVDFYDSTSGEKQIILSSRVGSEIDLRERTYFGLLPKLTNFVSARVYVDCNSLRLHIEQSIHGLLKDTSRICTKDEIVALVTLVENFESGIAENLSLSNDLYIKKNVKLFRDAPSITLLTDDDQEFYGRIACVRDSSIVFLQSSEMYNWMMSSTQMKKFSSSRIRHIVTGVTRHYWNGFFIGFTAGTIVTSIFKAADISREYGSFESGIFARSIAESMAFVGLPVGLMAGLYQYLTTPEYSIIPLGDQWSFEQNFVKLKAISIFPDEYPP